MTHTQWLSTQLKANFYACSLELCTKTYQKGELRVHSHCYFKKDQKKIRATVHDIFRFRDSQPHLKADDSWGCHRGGMGGWGCILPPGAEDRVLVPSQVGKTV